MKSAQVNWDGITQIIVPHNMFGNDQKFNELHSIVLTLRLQMWAIM